MKENKEMKMQLQLIKNQSEANFGTDNKSQFSYQADLTVKTQNNRHLPGKEAAGGGAYLLPGVETNLD